MQSVKCAMWSQCRPRYPTGTLPRLRYLWRGAFSFIVDTLTYEVYDR